MQFLWTMLRVGIQAILDAQYRIEHKLDLLTHSLQMQGIAARMHRPAGAFYECPTCLAPIRISSDRGYAIRSCDCDRTEPHALPQEIPTELSRRGRGSSVDRDAEPTEIAEDAETANRPIQPTDVHRGVR